MIIKLTPDERKTLEAGAKAAKLPLSVWARSVLMEAASRLL